MAEQASDFGFSYEYGLDVLDEDGTTWLPFRVPTGISPDRDAVTAEAGTYDDLGSPNQAVLSESWTMTFNVQQHRYADGKYFEEVERLLALTQPDAVGEDAVGTFRWYDKPAEGTPNPGDAFEGEATVKMTRAQTDNAGIGGWSVTLTGVGRRRQITNPWTGWDTETP